MIREPFPSVLAMFVSFDSLPIRYSRLLSCFFICVAFLSPTSLSAQSREQSPLWMEYLAERIENGELSPEDGQDLAGELVLLAENPLNINTATAVQLRRLTFLGEYRIQSLINYRRSKPEGIASLYDLKLIDGWDAYTIALALPFFKMDSPAALSLGRGFTEKLHHAFRYGKATVSLSGFTPLRHDSRFDQMEGSAFGTSIRAEHNHGSHLQMGVLADIDAGEAFSFDRGGYDYYSAHFIVRDLGLLRDLAIGDYRVGYGYGLVATQSFRFGGLLSLTPERRVSGVRRAYSGSESNYLRGIATTIGNDECALSIASSWQPLDARVEQDEFGDRYIRSITRTGLHRTSTEVDRRHASSLQSYIAHLTHRTDRSEIGITGVLVRWGGDILARPSGVDGVDPLTNLSSFANLSADYSYSFGQGNLILFGETAYALRTRSVATYNGATYTSRAGGSYMVSVRHIPSLYWSYYGNVDGRYAGAWNEQGLSLTLAQPLPAYAEIRAGIDFYRSFTPRYGRKQVSKGIESAASFLIRPQTNLSFDLRVRHTEEKQYKRRSYMAASCRWTLARRYMLQGDIRYVLNSSYHQDLAEFAPYTHGYSLSLRADMTHTSQLSTSVGGSFFRSDSGIDRLYLSEKGIRQTFLLPMVYGDGYRGYGLLRWSLPHFSIEGKAEYTSSSRFDEPRTSLLFLLRWYIFRS